jgi:hypothetical protein
MPPPFNLVPTPKSILKLIAWIASIISCDPKARFSIKVWHGRHTLCYICIIVSLVQMYQLWFDLSLSKVLFMTITGRDILKREKPLEWGQVLYGYLGELVFFLDEQTQNFPILQTVISTCKLMIIVVFKEGFSSQNSTHSICQWLLQSTYIFS